MRRGVVLLFVCAACSEGATPEVQEAEGFTFVDATGEWGLDFVHDAGVTAEKHLPETMGAGAALADFDSDGDLDLYVVNSGANVLYQNKGDGTFEDDAAKHGVDHTGSGRAAAWAGCAGSTGATAGARSPACPPARRARGRPAG